MAFGTPANRRRKASDRFRCSMCGRERHRVIVHRTDGVHDIVPACPDHPEAPVLEWSAVDQGAAIWIEQMLLLHTWDVVRNEIEALVDSGTSARVRALLPVLALMEAWGGCLPERARPALAEARGGNALYDRGGS